MPLGSFLDLRLGANCAPLDPERRYRVEALFSTASADGVARGSTALGADIRALEAVGDESIDRELSRHVRDYLALGSPGEEDLRVWASLAPPGGPDPEWGVGRREFIDYRVDTAAP